MKKQKGSILAIVIIFIFIFTLLGMFAMRLVILQNETSDSELYYTRAHFAALYGSDLAMYHIMQWENIATGTTTISSYGRKFLVDDPSCLNWSGNQWYPLEKIQNDGTIETFTDSISGGDASGIRLYCHVEEEIPNPNDGFIPNTDPDSLDQRYGTYKFYVIVTTATMYSDYENSKGKIAEAKDELHFFIAYSSGTDGARPLTTISADTAKGYPAIPGISSLTGEYVVRVTTVNAPYIVSADRRSFITGEVVPIFRYYIRGRR